MGFFRGFWAPFRGAAFISKHRLWGYVALPVVLNVVLAVMTTTVGVRLVRHRLGADWVASSPVTAWVVLAVLSALVGLLLFILLQPIVGAPFIDALTEKVEAIVLGRAPRVGLVAAAWEAIRHGLLKFLLYGVALAIALALSAVSGVGGIVGFAVYALFLAYDAFEYPMARRRISFGGKWRYIALHPAQTLGYCLGASLLYAIPLAIVVAPSFGAVGATLAYLITMPPSSPSPPTEKGPTT